MNTVLFAAARHAATRGDVLQAIPSTHPAHSSHFPFGDDHSRRNYERVLRGDDLPNVRNPIVIVCGNAPGIGKTRLVRAMISAIHGDESPAVTRQPSSAEQFSRAVESALLDGREYIWFDDWNGKLPCNPICHFATAETAHFRLLGTHETVKKEINLRIYVSGNSVYIPSDVMRRARVIDLFLPAPVAAASA